MVSRGIANEFDAEGGFSIFIAGSNPYLLSGEMDIRLTGHYGYRQDSCALSDSP